MEYYKAPGSDIFEELLMLWENVQNIMLSEKAGWKSYIIA